MVDLTSLVEQLGEEQARDILMQHLEGENREKENVLTIVVNKGVHYLPRENLKGTVFYASEGNLDFSTARSVQEEFERILKGVSAVLKSRNWRKIFVVPFGPCALSMQIKLLIYRITGIESNEVFYLGEGKYMNLQVDQRCIIVGTE